jgi:hypothetical protein
MADHSSPDPSPPSRGMPPVVRRRARAVEGAPRRRRGSCRRGLTFVTGADEEAS